MTTVKNESLGSVFVKDGRLKWIHINSNAIPKKAPEPIGPTSTPKTSVQLEREAHLELIRNYRAAADELYWRYRGRGAIIQNLRMRLIAYESLISELAPEKVLSIMSSNLPSAAKKEGPTTLETGQTKTS